MLEYSESMLEQCQYSRVELISFSQFHGHLAHTDQSGIKKPQVQKRYERWSYRVVVPGVLVVV